MSDKTIVLAALLCRQPFFDPFENLEKRKSGHRVGVYMYYSDADSQYYVDTQIAFTGSIDFTFEFGLVDPTIAIDSDTTAVRYYHPTDILLHRLRLTFMIRSHISLNVDDNYHDLQTLYTGTAVTITYMSVISLTLTPMVTMTVGSASSVVATGTLAISTAANTEVTSTTTYKGSDNTFTPTTSQSSGISMPTLTDTSFDVTSGGSDVSSTDRQCMYQCPPSLGRLMLTTLSPPHD